MPEIWAKTSRFGLRKPNLHVLSYISGKSGRIELSIFALKLYVLAGRFESNKQYDFENFIFTL